MHMCPTKPRTPDRILHLSMDAVETWEDSFGYAMPTIVLQKLYIKSPGTYAGIDFPLVHAILSKLISTEMEISQRHN